MVNVRSCIGPSYGQLRSLSSGRGPFPIIPGLVETLTSAPSQPDETIARVLGTCAGYAYSDESTVATMMTRLGIPDNRCLQISEIVDAMFICSNAFVVQSSDNRVVIVCYRGTEPANIINWLTDLTIEPTCIQIPPREALGQANGDLYVHGGFYRNVRATRYRVGEALAHALAQRSIHQPDIGDTAATLKPLEALYITGHSLGGAMAALMTILIHTDPDYAPLRPLLKGVYTFGQPMIGSPDLAAACEASGIGALLHRYVYRHDVVPQVPPKQNGRFKHFGNERRYVAAWEDRPSSEQMDALGLLEVPLDFAARQIPGLAGLQFRYSLDDHGPQYYIQALTPAGAATEFGDTNLGVVPPPASPAVLNRLTAPLRAIAGTGVRILTNAR
jgi:hypothetical protein